MSAPTAPAAPSPHSPDSPDVLARIKEGLDLVDLVARQLRRQFGPFIQLEDLTSYGREALLAAARSFDPDRGVPFRRWANLRIRGAMIDGVRSQGNLPRRVYRQVRALQAADRVHEAAAENDASTPAASAEAADAKLSEQLGSAAMAMALSFLSMKSGDAVDDAHDPSESPEDEVARAELVATIRTAIAERPEAERKLLERHYFDDVTFEEAAAELGLSKSWASRLHARAIEGVARAMKRARIEE
ncbi:RNA polymerase sigma factor for flagellar operon [Labilithrix luteola]|uniref:RNA polymerase sigma factor for flagellar operon n=1 Tax=Labilithrix luteola TaxID=1391654 RepID=A0A0K1Q5B4_9BACT|nr:sigma-70 family RNA polymerase sigma factor [Labilithrix luteola]AKV00842.1 RNA polymerase sigma factor for flagellar operon [Labilithrix luteola]